MIKHTLRCLCLGAVLTACSQAPETANDDDVDSASEAAATQDQTEVQPTASADESSANLERIADNPQALREAMRNPDQRESLIQAMRERRQARRAERDGDGEDGDIDRTAMLEQMRERRAEMMAERGADGGDPRSRMRERMLERSRWWANEDIRATIGLSEDQAESLTTAQTQLEDQRQAIRESLGQSQRELMAAVREGNRASILDVVEQRTQAQQNLQAMELQWWRTLLDELSEEQLTTLAEENPQVLMRRGGR